MIQKATELELIRRAREGDGDAMAELIRAHQAALYAFMLRMSGRPHIAEDIVQEAFVRVLRNLDRFDSRFRFSTWVFTIAKRLYVNAMQKHRPLYDTDAVGLADGGGGDAPYAASIDEEASDNTRDLLEQAMDELNPQQRDIVVLFHHQCWSISDIADHLSMPEGTVKSHLHRARHRMRRVIEGDDRLHARALEVLR